MQDEVQVQCPWCFEWITLWIAVDEQGASTMDCAVCCRPWVTWVARGSDGKPQVSVRRES